MRRSAICCLTTMLFAVVLSVGQTTATKRTENPGFPRVVARIKLWQKTGPLSITLFTPKHFGTYRISGVMVITAQNGNPYYGTIAYTDGGGLEQFSFSSQGSRGDLEVGPFSLRDHPWVPIQLSINSYGEQGGKYNLFVVVEQIM
jgi:hypothetical protein